MLCSQDIRGSLTSIKDIPFEVKEILISKNYKNVLRGLHQSPYAKRIFIIKGRIYDFTVNPDNLEKKEIILGVGDYIDVPRMWGHGFYSEEESEIMYLLEDKFDSEKDKNIFWDDPRFNFQFKFPKLNLIISEKDKNSFYANKYDFFVLGARGYLGSACVNILKKQGFTVFESNERLCNISKIDEQIIKSQCKYLICAAGISGRPTVEWCETHEEETYNTNYLAIIDLMRCCKERNIHTTIFGSGLVYTGIKKTYTEEDIPDLTSKVYSKWRCELEKVIPFYKNVLYLRILYPITFDSNEKSFLTKMLQRKNSVNNVRVSITVVDDLFCHISLLCKKNIIGIYNFVNKGSIRLPELLQLYSDIKNEEIKMNIVSVEKNNEGFDLSTEKLEKIIVISRVHDAIYRYLN
jgi:dTDP-4-dehydrorhamnose 3,5-epimerase-like enzyme/dTDP-4-dehydrorhamnose reductase